MCWYIFNSMFIKYLRNSTQYILQALWLLMSCRCLNTYPYVSIYVSLIAVEMMGFCWNIRLEKLEDPSTWTRGHSREYIYVGFTSWVVITACGHVIILQYYKFMVHWQRYMLRTINKISPPFSGLGFIQYRRLYFWSFRKMHN